MGNEPTYEKHYLWRVMKNQSWLLVKAFRPLNLLMLAFTMLFIRYYIVLCILQNNFRIASTLADWQFALMVIGTVLITAAGYLLNDHFDRDIDEINHGEEKPTLQLSERTVVITCLILDMVGIGLGYLVSYWAGVSRLGLVFVLAAALLLIYSKFLKKYGPLGNLVVSLLAAMAVVLPAVVETSILHPDESVTQLAAPYVWKAVGAYALFAFLLTFAREVLKDVEDMQGDRLGERKTIPVVAGEKAGKFVTIILLLLMVRVLVSVQQSFIKDENFYMVGYIAALIEIPAIAAMIMTYLANSVKAYHRVSVMLKVIMLAGVLSAAFYSLV